MSDVSRDDFSWAGCFWRATILLPPWRGFQSRRGSYGAPESDSASDGNVEVVFAPEGRDESPLRDHEVELVRWAVQNTVDVQRSLLEGLLARYPSLRQKYVGFASPEEMPPVRGADDFRPLIGLHSMNVHPPSCSGSPSVMLASGLALARERPIAA